MCCRSRYRRTLEAYGDCAVGWVVVRGSGPIHQEPRGLSQRLASVKSAQAVGSGEAVSVVQR